MTAESIDTTVFLRKSYNNIRTKMKRLHLVELFYFVLIDGFEP